MKECGLTGQVRSMILKKKMIFTGVDITDLNDIEEFELPTLGRDILLTGVGEICEKSETEDESKRFAEKVEEIDVSKEHMDDKHNILSERR